MDYPSPSGEAGAFDARYLAFLETIANLRPALHRYCARMTGSVLDGEDIVQESLFHAYRKLDTFDDRRPPSPWLFRIAHNRCIDFLRNREVRREAETASAETPVVLPVDPPGASLNKAVEFLVLALPPMERACVLLKDVLDYSLEETAEFVDSTVGAVKSALHRGRAQLDSSSPPAKTRRAPDPELSQLLQLYVDRFNRRDWDGLRELISADARIRVPDRFAGPAAGAPYFGRYEMFQMPWRLTLGELDGVPVVIVLRQTGETWTPHCVVRIHIEDHQVQSIADYTHCPWMLSAGNVSLTAPAS